MDFKSKYGITVPDVISGISEALVI